MKKVFLRAISVLLILAALVTVFTSCGKEKSPTVMSYGKASMNENMFFFELAIMKTTFIEEYTGSTVDIPLLWTQEMSQGVTLDDFIYAQCQVKIARVLYFADYALTHGGELTSDDRKTIKSTLDEYVSSYGSKQAVNKYLENYSINYDIYEDYLELYALYNKGLQLAYSENGERFPGVEDMYTYYTNNYVTVKHIAIGTVIAGTDEAGNYIYLTEEEQAEKLALVDTIKNALENGESFEDYMKYSEDPDFEKNYPNGYTLTKGAHQGEKEEYEAAALSLEKEGDWTVIEIENAGTFIIKRVPLLDSDFENCYPTILNDLVEIDMESAVFENYDGFFMDQTILDNYNMAMIPVLV